MNLPGCVHFGYNSQNNIAVATQLSVKLWIPRGISAKCCVCSLDNVFIDVYNIIREYRNIILTKEEIDNWQKYKKPDFLTKKSIAIRQHSNCEPICELQPNSAQPIIENFPKKIVYGGKKYRLNEVRGNTLRYRCICSKCVVSLTLYKKDLTPRDGNYVMPNHKPECTNNV